jgi:hypothetical protein
MDQILSSIDAEIAKLQEAKRLLSGSPDLLPAVVRRGRPKSSTKAASDPASAQPRRVMSAEGRARIAEAQRKRHAARKRAAKKAASEEATGE